MESNLDLVKIAPQAKPPVCKVMDYGKYRFEQAKREKENKKNQRTFDIKEVRLSLNIDVHDFNTKLNNALKFIKKGDKVKVSIRFRGREMGHPEQGYDTMNRFAKACEEVAVIEKPAKLEGRNIKPRRLHHQQTVKMRMCAAILTSRHLRSPDPPLNR